LSSFLFRPPPLDSKEADVLVIEGSGQYHMLPTSQGFMAFILLESQHPLHSDLPSLSPPPRLASAALSVNFLLLSTGIFNRVGSSFSLVPRSGPSKLKIFFDRCVSSFFPVHVRLSVWHPFSAHALFLFSFSSLLPHPRTKNR